MNEKIFETNDQIRINKIQIKLDNIEKKLKDNYSPYLHPAQLIASKEFLQLLNTNKDIKSHEEQYIWLKNYYTAYKNGTYIILNLIDSATPFIETRKLELKPRLNVEEIIQRWIDSKIVGRSCFYEINGNYCKDFHFTISQNRRAQMLVNKALSEGRNNNFETAIQFIENAYKSDDKLQDAYAKLGWIYTNNKEWDKAWEIAKHDYDKKRLSSTWKIKVAEILLRTNHVSQSIQLIFDAYDENPQLKNCYARLGWILGYTTKNWEYALKIAYKDLETNRLDAMWKMRIGLIFGNTFNIDMADKLIAESYQENEKLTDGYAKLGWILYKKNIIDQAIKFTKRDIKFNRLSVFWKSKIIDLIEICETEVV